MAEQSQGRCRGTRWVRGGQEGPGHVQPVSQGRELEFYPEDSGGHGELCAGELTPSGLCFETHTHTHPKLLHEE